MDQNITTSNGLLKSQEEFKKPIGFFSRLKSTISRPIVETMNLAKNLKCCGKKRLHSNNLISNRTIVKEDLTPGNPENFTDHYDNNIAQQRFSIT